MRFQDYIIEDKHTDYLETASCLGTIISDSLAKRIDNFFEEGENAEEIREEIKSYLNTNYD